MVNSHQMLSIKIDKHDEYWTVVITTSNRETLPKHCDTYEEVEQVVKTALAANHPDQRKIEHYTEDDK